MYLNWKFTSPIFYIPSTIRTWSSKGSTSVQAITHDISKSNRESNKSLMGAIPTGIWTTHVTHQQGRERFSCLLLASTQNNVQRLNLLYQMVEWYSKFKLKLFCDNQSLQLLLTLFFLLFFFCWFRFWLWLRGWFRLLTKPKQVKELLESGFWSSSWSLFLRLSRLRRGLSCFILWLWN